jgi:parallel beta-helix repeat protein
MNRLTGRNILPKRIYVDGTHLDRLKPSGFAVLVLLVVLSLAGTVKASTQQGTITIKTNADFANCGCVSGGSGSQANPYVLSGLTLISQTAPGLLVDNTKGGITNYFDLTGDTITGGNGPTTNFPGVEFINVNGLGEITGTGNTISGNQYGVLLKHSSHILIDGGSSSNGATVNDNGVAGIAVVGGGSNTIENIQVNHNGIGIPEGFLGGGMGIQLNSTSFNTVSNVMLSEDALSGIGLFSSSGNIVNGVVVHYPDFYGAIVDGGKSNTIENNVFQTGDYVGLWVRDLSSSNLITGNTIYANGPTGHEVNPGIVPYFTVGLYISSGASGNTVSFNNFNNGNTGGSIIQDNGKIVNAVQSPIQSNNLFNNPATGNEPTKPIFPSGPAGSGNFFCGNAIVSSQGVPSNPPCP